MLYRADFHIHSCLSPCASLEMTPAAIVEQAQVAGLNTIALSDHNCALNLPAFARACDQLGMECLFGMEVTSVEEAHMLCLFDNLESATKLGELVYESLPAESRYAERFIDQPIIDEKGQIQGYAEKFLICSTPFRIPELIKMVHDLGGLFVPAHIDRQVFGIIASLGYLPEEDFDAVELTTYGDPSLAQNYPIMRNSDSHQLANIGNGFTELDCESLTVANIRRSIWQTKNDAGVERQQGGNNL